MKKFFSGLIVFALALNFVSAFGTEAGTVRAVYTERGVTTEITYDNNNNNIATRHIIVAPTMGYLSPDASETFQKIHVVSFDKSTLWMPNVFSFKHKGNTRILVGENGRALEIESLDLSSQLPEGRISIYEPSDLTKPLARKYLASTDISRIPIEIGDVSEYGDNIIIGGEGGFVGILEVNPENCNIPCFNSVVWIIGLTFSIFSVISIVSCPQSLLEHTTIGNSPDFFGLPLNLPSFRLIPSGSVPVYVHLIGSVPENLNLGSLRFIRCIVNGFEKTLYEVLFLL